MATATSSISSLSTTVNTINGKGTKYFQSNSTAAKADASGQEAVAIGPQAVASGASSFAAGNGAKATADGTVAVGFGAQATGANGIAIGTGSQATATGTAIGFGAVVQQSGGVALGSGSVASRAAGVAGYIPGSANAQQEAAIRATTSTQAAVSVGDAANGQFRQITGVAAGSADSDAANVAQLKAASTAAKASSVQYATNPDGSVNYNQITLGGGQALGGTRISNVAPGIAPTDAVNMGQLGAVQSRLQGQIASMQRIAYSGVAMAAAMSTLPQAMTPGKTLLSVGVGNYAGYSAIAIGFSSRSNDGKWVYKINSGYSGTRFNIGVGVGYEFE
ncbi:YadA family autotransporter adhesin [Variovorax sp. LT1R20]|uniref:YadA family autotransporter adhesin n=1 Tax=Variovorax sp. LT1R20 TaxID=3443729 RepID=UPI003F485D41